MGVSVQFARVDSATGTVFKDESIMEITKSDVERICLDTMRTTLNDYELIKAELESLKSGQRVLLPVDLDHAKFMLLVAQRFISDVHNETMKAIKGKENA